MDLEKRRAFIHDIDDVLVNADSTVENILNALAWSKEHLLNKTNPAICPFDNGHEMPVSSLKKHSETCSWIKEDYTKEEKEKAVPSSKFFYENATTVVTVLIDKDLQNQILHSSAQQFGASLAMQSQFQDKNLPRTMDRAMSELTTQDRFAIYDYAVSQGKAANVKNIFQLEDLRLMLDKKLEEPQKEKSRLEILAELRDYKRRRQSYRAKNVHITKKSYTEVLRNLIDNQMQILNPTEENDTNSNHASSESSPPRDINLKRKADDTTDFSFTSCKRSRDSRSPEYTKNSYSWTQEHERSRKRYSDERDISASSKSHKSHRSRSDDKRESHTRSSKRDHHHHSRESSRSHKKSHKKHKHSHHRSSSED